MHLQEPLGAELLELKAGAVGQPAGELQLLVAVAIDAPLEHFKSLGQRLFSARDDFGQLVAASPEFDHMTGVEDADVGDEFRLTNSRRITNLEQLRMQSSFEDMKHEIRHMGANDANTHLKTLSTANLKACWADSRKLGTPVERGIGVILRRPSFLGD